MKTAGGDQFLDEVSGLLGGLGKICNRHKKIQYRRFRTRHCFRRMQLLPGTDSILAAMQRQLIQARLRSRTLLSARTQTFHFSFEVEGAPFTFEAGQFVSFVAEDARGKSQTRAYSIASAPAENTFDLCANRVEGGFFSNLLADMPVGGTVHLHGPHGLFTLRQPLTDTLLIATGTGIAPMRGFLQKLFPVTGGRNFPESKRLWMIYGTRNETELYYAEEFRAIASANSNMQYLPTLSRASNDWTGARGYVQSVAEQVLSAGEVRLGAAPGADRDPMHPESQTLENPRRPESNQPPESFGVHAYICGLNAMVASTRELLKSLGWHRKQIIFERYD